MEPSKAVPPLDDEEDEQVSSHLPPNQPVAFEPTNFSIPQMPSEPMTSQLLAASYQQFAANRPTNHPVEQPPINCLPINAFPYPPNQFRPNQPAASQYFYASNHQRYNQPGYYFNFSGYPYADFQPNQYSQPPKSFDRSELNSAVNKPCLPNDSGQLIDLRKRNLTEEAGRRDSPTERISENDSSCFNEPATSDDKNDEKIEQNVIRVDPIAGHDAGSQIEADGRTDTAPTRTDNLQSLQSDLTDQLKSISTRASPIQAHDQTQSNHPKSTSRDLFAPVDSSSSAGSKSTQPSPRPSSLSARSIACSFSSLIRTPPMPQDSQTLRTPAHSRTESISEQPESQIKLVEETQVTPIRSPDSVSNEIHPSQKPTLTAVHKTAALSEIAFIANLKSAILRREASAITELPKDSEDHSSDPNSDGRFDLSEVGDSNDDLKFHLRKLDRLLEIARTYLNVSEVLKNQIKDLGQKILVFESKLFFFGQFRPDGGR